MRGANITGASSPSIVSGDYSTGSDTAIVITFTVDQSGDMCTADNQGNNSCGIAFWFGAHVAKTVDWQPFNGTTGASSISGSPYHVALSQVDESSVGDRDNQMASSAIILESTITIHKITDPATDTTTSFTFNTTGTGYIGFDLTGGTQNQQNVSPGTYTVTETVPSAWSNTALTCTASGDGTSATTDLVNHSVSITIGSTGGGVVDCTYTNTLQQGTLIIKKHVINDNGGTATDGRNGSAGCSNTDTAAATIQRGCNTRH